MRYFHAWGNYFARAASLLVNSFLLTISMCLSAKSYLCCRDPKPIWVQQCALDQGGPIFRSINANLLSCKKHPHLPALILLRFYIWFLFYTILFTTEIVIWNLNCLRYGNASYVDERHRHRYEVNPDMVPEFEKAGLSFVGRDESGRRMEVWSQTFFIKIINELMSMI